MKGVLIGTDFIKSSDGNYKAIEMNTNIDLYEGESLHLNEYIDLTSLRTLLIDNSITEFVYINPGNEAAPKKAKTIFELLADELGITFTMVITPPSSVTIPFVEDSDTKFILRHSYDSTALIDDTYCNDNYEFAKLIEGQPFATKKIIKDSSFSLSDFNSVDTSTSYPNVVVKSRYPNYNTIEFPKLFKLDTEVELQELADIAQSTETYVEEYVISDDTLIDNSVNIIRSVDIVYGPTLSTMHLGSHHITSRLEIDLADDVYNADKEINQIGRVRYSTKNSMNIFSNNIRYHVDAESKIRMPDGTFADILSLETGSVVSSPSFQDFDTMDSPSYKLWKGDYISTQNTFGLNESAIVGIASASVSTIFIDVTLEDGTSWQDLPSTPMYLELKDSLDTEFKNLDEIEVGDKIILYNNTTNELEKLAITDLNVVFKNNFDIYQIDIEPTNLFLSSIDNVNNRSIIMHNNGCSACYGFRPNCGYTYCWWFCYFCYKSDINYKENLNLIGQSPSGINIYQFNYIGEEGLYEGVIAQELIGTEYESALQLDDTGKYLVDYSKIDVEHKKLS